MLAPCSEPLRWKIERAAIVAVRHPAQYMISLSAFAAGIFTSLDESDRVKVTIDDLPYIQGSDWLFFTFFTLAFAVVLRLGSWAIGSVWGVQPFEAIASYADSARLWPDLAGYVDRRLTEAQVIEESETGKLPSGKLPYRVRLIKESELIQFSQLNREIFAYTAFSLPLHAVSRRNTNLFRANPHMFAFVEAELPSGYVTVGISHVVPLNSIGSALYLRNNGLRDAEISERHIAPLGVWADVIVLFSMGLVRPARGRLEDKHLALPYVYADHLVQIIKTMRGTQGDRTHITVCAQTERPAAGIGRMLSHLGFVETGMISGDGFPLWEMNMPLTALSVPLGSSDDQGAAPICGQIASKIAPGP
jgi:hypothetical protein